VVPDEGRQEGAKEKWEQDCKGRLRKGKHMMLCFKPFHTCKKEIVVLKYLETINKRQ